MRNQNRATRDIIFLPDVKRVFPLPVLLAGITLVVAAAMAQERTGAQQLVRDSIFETQYSCNAQGPQSSLSPEDLTVLNFTIGASTIRDVHKRFPDTHSVKLADQDGAEQGICIKNKQGIAAVFATDAMGAPDTLVAIYLAPARLVESSRLACKSVALAPTMFSSQSGIRVGATATQVAKALRDKIPADGTFCAAHEIASSRGPLRISKDRSARGDDFTDFTGAEGHIRSGTLEWVKLFGIASD